MNSEAINGLTALAAIALLLLAVMTSVLRGQADSEGYAIASLHDEADGCRRQLRTLEMECARVFADFVGQSEDPSVGETAAGQAHALQGARP